MAYNFYGGVGCWHRLPLCRKLGWFWSLWAEHLVSDLHFKLRWFRWRAIRGSNWFQDPILCWQSHPFLRTFMSGCSSFWYWGHCRNRSPSTCLISQIKIFIIEHYQRLERGLTPVLRAAKGDLFVWNPPFVVLFSLSNLVLILRSLFNGDILSLPTLSGVLPVRPSLSGVLTLSMKHPTLNGEQFWLPMTTEFFLWFGDLFVVGVRHELYSM